MPKAGFFLVVLFLSVKTFAQQSYKSAIVSFYNFENFYDTIFHGSNDDEAFTPHGAKAYTSAVFNDKVQKLATVLSQIGTDVNPDGPALLGAAEIENQFVLDTLLKHPLIAKRNYKYVHYNSRDFRGVDVALIYNPKYFKVERSRPIYVQLPQGSKTAFFTRDILWVQGLLDGEKINVFVNHWPSRSGGEKRSEPARMAAAVTLRKFLDSLNIIYPNTKSIIMGDLNDDPVNNSITIGLQAKDDIKKLKTDELYNPWVDYYKSGLGTLAYQDSWSLFDQIIISQDWLDKKQAGFFYYKSHVFKPEFLIENFGQYKGYPKRTYSGDVYNYGYSDHFPTYLVLLKKVQ
ncbi:MAG: endonuclease/exonuclease/phosphatase [Sphingobacteriales bacterium 41-5]|nr:MAG: endonuclease/exonuclease/phosphatase [Sphingobacteriales bacterium 41-5]